MNQNLIPMNEDQDMYPNCGGRTGFVLTEYGKEALPEFVATEPRFARLKAFIREYAPGGCKIVACECPLCDVGEIRKALYDALTQSLPE